MNSVSVDALGGSPYVEMLCYPSASPAEAEARLAELRTLGITAVCFEGPTKLGALSLLGKGCVSLVVIGEREGREYALKIRRVDANRPTLLMEAELHRKANSAGVGPSLHGASANFLLMDRVQGARIYDWLRLQRGRGTTERIRQVLRNLLEQCFALDRVGLDHGELSNLAKHVLVNERPVIIDFESASLMRRTSNVTAATQALWIGGPWANRLRRLVRSKSREQLVEALRAYKRNPSELSFRSLLQVLGFTKQY